MAPIHHVTVELQAAQVDDCVAFYGLLGFGQVPVPDGIAGRALWLEDESGSGQQVHLMFAEAESPRTGHFALVAPDFDTTTEALRAAGHEVDPRRAHWGSPRAYVRDPAGNLIELMREPPSGRGAGIAREPRK